MQKLKHVDGDFSWCMRQECEDTEAKTRDNENARGKGGGRQRLRHVHGDVPLSMRSKGEEDKNSSSEKKLKGGSSSKKDNKIKATCGSRDLCGSRTIKENKERVKTDEKRHYFHRASKNTRSMNSIDRIEQMMRELAGYRWDAITKKETWRPSKSELWETHQGHIFMGAGKKENKHGVGILPKQEMAKKNQ